MKEGYFPTIIYVDRSTKVLHFVLTRDPAIT